MIPNPVAFQYELLTTYLGESKLSGSQNAHNANKRQKTINCPLDTAIQMSKNKSQAAKLMPK